MGAGRGDRVRIPGGFAPVLAALSIPLLLAGCGTPGAGTAGREAAPSGPRPGTTVVGLEFLRSHENDPSEPYYPITGIAGCEFTGDGTLVFCDEKRGKIHGLDPRRRTWFEFDSPLVRPYAPVDVRLDGFKVLALDMGAGQVYRFDLSGALLDVAVDLRYLDPGFPVLASAFDVDRDGRMVVTDPAREQVLLLDSFLSLVMRVGDPGTSSDRFDNPSGILFLSDGGFVVSDQGNSRLNVYGRLGFYERSVGGLFDRRNPFVAPQGLASDRFGNVFVADPGCGLIHVLDARLTPVMSLGRDFPLAGAPQAPIDVAVGPDRLLAVSDRARSAVLVYRIIYE